MLGPAAGDLRRLAPDTPAEVVLEAIELRQERPTHAERKTTWRDRLALLGCGLVAAVVGIIFLAGLADVLGLITGK
jgi:hypothetical protein